jgi:hypothetical protein
MRTPFATGRPVASVASARVLGWRMHILKRASRIRDIGFKK